LPLIKKLITAYKIWHKVLPDMPRLDRYSLGEKVTTIFTDLIELILTGSYVSKEHKLLMVQKASIKLDVLKFFLQLVWELEAIDNKKFADISVALSEVGKMIGGWQKQLTK
jgi:hypothetical protein